LKLPSWSDLSSKISKFQEDADDLLQNKIGTFKDNNPLLDKTIRSIIQILPPPFNIFFENFYNTTENSDLTKRLEEIKRLVLKIQDRGEKDYNTNSITAGGDVIGLNVDGDGNIIAKNISIVITEAKEFFGLDLIPKGYFNQINKEAIKANFDDWVNGFELSMESIYDGREFRRQKVLDDIKTLLGKNRKLLLLGESGTSKTTLLLEVLSDYYKEGYIILHTNGTTEPREPNKIIESIRDLLNTGNKILVVVDNVHEKKMASIFYVIKRLDYYYSGSTTNSEIRFILCARQPEYKKLIGKQRFDIDVHYADALDLLNNTPNFTLDLPPFTRDEVKGFIKQFSSYLPENRKNKSLEQNTDEIFKETLGHPVLVRYEVTGGGLRKDIENRFRNYLSINDDGRKRPDYNKIIVSFVCSIYHISTLAVDDTFLKNMKMSIYEDGLPIERNLYWFANELERSILYRDASNGEWKTLHVRWALELFRFIFDTYKDDRNLVEKFKESLSFSISLVIKNESGDNILNIYNTMYNTVPANKCIDFRIIEEVANVPQHLSNSAKVQLYTLIIGPSINDQIGKEEAIKCYDKIITDLDPSYIPAYFNKGFSLLSLGDLGDPSRYEEAIKCYDKILTDLDPKNIKSYINRGGTLTKLGDLGDPSRHEEALECYDKIITDLDNKNVNAYFGKGATLTKLGNLGDPGKHEEAIKCYDKIITDLDPSYIPAYGNKGVSLVSLGDLGDPSRYEEAIKCYNKIISDLDPDNVDAYVNLGSTLAKLGDLGDPSKYEEAIKCYDKVITDLDPDNVDAYMNKGSTLGKLGDLGDPSRYEEAIKCFYKIISDLDPNDVNVYLSIGYALTKLGDLGNPSKYEEAIEHLDKIIAELDPNNIIAHFRSGLVLSKLGDLGDPSKYEEAIEYFDKIINNLDPSNIPTYLYKATALANLGDLGDPSKYEEAIKCHDKILTDLDPNNVMANYFKGILVTILGDLGDASKYEEAIKCYDKIIKDLEPNNADVYFKKATVLTSLGNLGDQSKYEEAIKCYNKIITDLDPTDVDAYFQKGVALGNLADLGDPSKYEDEIKCYNKIITDLNPNYTSAYLNKGVALDNLADLGDPSKYEEAMKCYDKILTDLDPNDARAYFNKGVVLRKVGDLGNPSKYVEAIKCHDKVIKVQPTFADAYYNRSLLKMIIKQTDSSLDDLEISIQFDKRFQEAARNEETFKILKDNERFKILINTRW
jgi:tetratricopeptide (TPR) repeat protein